MRTHPADQLRPISIHCGFLENQPGSVLYASGLTRVLCVATLEASVPPFLQGKGRGWATSEYSLLPGSTRPRKQREGGTRVSGRTQEIQRIIGRSLRAAIDFAALGERTLRLDCDVLQADGGTRTASISGAWIAAGLAVAAERNAGQLERSPLTSQVAAVSVGMASGECLLDLDQREDSSADVDLNVVALGDGGLVEVQGTAEGHTFSRADLNRMLDLAERGIAEIRELQTEALRRAGVLELVF